MKDEDLRKLYAVLVGGLFAAVALWRHDLVLQAWHATAATWARGGRPRARLLGEIVLFGGVLSATWHGLPTEARPARDTAVFLLAAAAGWCAEAWGTRLGLWTYYTGERPPLWIVPAWPLGAILIDRAAEAARARFGDAGPAAYWALASLMLAVCAAMTAPWLGPPSRWLGVAAAGVALFAAADPKEEFWVLACGLACVFFADLWGTTNGCWAYPLIAPRAPWRGVPFGMAFDTAVAAGCLRLARRAAP